MGLGGQLVLSVFFLAEDEEIYFLLYRCNEPPESVGNREGKFTSNERKYETKNYAESSFQ